MWYRIGATRNMTGGRKIQPTLKMSDKLKEVRKAVVRNAEGGIIARTIISHVFGIGGNVLSINTTKNIPTNISKINNWEPAYLLKCHKKTILSDSTLCLSPAWREGKNDNFSRVIGTA